MESFVDLGLGEIRLICHEKETTEAPTTKYWLGLVYGLLFGTIINLLVTPHLFKIWGIQSLALRLLIQVLIIAVVTALMVWVFHADRGSEFFVLCESGIVYNSLPSTPTGLQMLYELIRGHYPKQGHQYSGGEGHYRFEHIEEIGIVGDLEELEIDSDELRACAGTLQPMLEGEPVKVSSNSLVILAQYNIRVVLQGFLSRLEPAELRECLTTIAEEHPGLVVTVSEEVAVNVAD